MKLTKLILHNYTRLYVTGIRHIEYIPEQPMQIVLASNGAGKSSLLKEIIPNVEELPNEYDVGGYRIAHYEHNTHTYILSYNKDTNKHSFKINNNELNNSGLKKIQKTLIEEHFNITKPIHELLLSTATFTTMTISERKKWFTEIITKIDYTNVLRIYNNTKSRIKDLTAFIKLTQSKILKDEELFNNMSEDDINDLALIRRDLLKMVTEAFNDKINVSNISSPNIHKLDLKRQELQSINTLLKDIPKEEILLKYRNNVESNIEFNKQAILDIDNEIDNLDNTIIETDFNTVELKETLKDIEEYFKEYNFLGDDILNTTKMFNKIYGRLTDIASELFDFINVDITKKEILINTILSTTTDINKINLSIRVNEKDLALQEGYSKHDDVTCPVCNNIFKPNFDNSLLHTLKNKLDELYTLKDKQEKVLKISNEELEDIKLKQQLMNNYKLLVESVPILSKSLISYLDDISTLTHNLNNIFISMPDETILNNKILEYEDINKNLDIVKNINASKVALIKNKYNALQDRRMKHLVSNNKNKTLLEKYNRYLRLYKTSNDLINSIDSIIIQNTLYSKEHKDILFNNYLDNFINLVQKEIQAIDNKLAEFRNVQEHYKGLQAELENYKIDLEANKHIEQLLSPSKGLIGKTMSATINTVLDKMNFIINQIWSYKISILPCDVTESELTFRFPVLINDSKSIPDIVKGSSSIREVIDLAFKITVMELLDMLQYPLILDEYSSSMDMANRVSSYEYIERLSKEYFSQVFMVSHFEEMFLRFASTTDVVVLNNDNIQYTGLHNEVMKIEKRV